MGVQYNGDGATVAFAVTFNFWDADDLRVILTETSSGTEAVWTRGTQYTVSGGSGTTGTVTVSTSPTDYTPASGYTLTIKSNITDTQDTSLPAGGSIPSASLEQQMDKIVRMVQQKDEELARAPKFAESSSQTDMTVPEPGTDGQVVGWSSSILANLTPNTDTYLNVTAFMLTVLDDTTAAAARTTLGAEAADADILKADTADVLTAGFAATPYNAGTKSSGTFTPDEANGNLQYAVNGGAHTLAPPTNNCTLVIQYTNDASAGSITTSGFTKVDGDTISTTNGDDFLFYITKLNGFSHLTVRALQ